MFAQSLYLPIVLIALVFNGCGSSNATNDSANNNFTILEGTVPGTLIEVFCGDGSYYHASSVDDGSSEHPFMLNIPKGLSCHLVMSTREDNISAKVITPIRIQTAEGNSTLFYSVTDHVDLGYVPLALDRADINDSTGDGVSDDLLNIGVISGTLVAVIGGTDPMDADGDGIIDLFEDDDNDGICNHDDDDDDNNGIDDADELDDTNDLDGDGIENGIDIDDDNDGIEDTEDSDDDNDGIEDSEDNDDDNDGVEDAEDSDDDYSDVH